MSDVKKSRTSSPLNTPTNRPKTENRAAAKPDAESEQPGKTKRTREAKPKAPAKPKARKPAATRSRKIGKVPQAAPAATPAMERPDEQALSIVMVTPEAHPFAKTGGLAEVAGSLPAALARLGHSVTLVLPRYRGISTAGLPALELTVSLGAHQQAQGAH